MGAPAGEVQQATAVDPDSVQTPMLRRLLDQFTAVGVWVSIWDLTSDVGLPVYSCSIGDTNPFGAIKTFGGTGCHLSKEIALSRALTEAGAVAAHLHCGLARRSVSGRLRARRR